MRTELERRYFDWLCSVIEDEDRLNYRKLLTYLYERSFVYILPMDGNHRPAIQRFRLFLRH